MRLLSDWADLTEYCFDEPQTFLDRLAQSLGLSSYEPPDPQQYRLYDELGNEIFCRLCGGNHWTDEETVWACDHSQDEEYLLVPMAVRDEKRINEASLFELI